MLNLKLYVLYFVAYLCNIIILIYPCIQIYTLVGLSSLICQLLVLYLMDVVFDYVIDVVFSIHILVDTR